MPTINERIRTHAGLLLTIETLKHRKETYYPEETIIEMLEALERQVKELIPLNKKIEQLKLRAADYLEVYKGMELKVMDLEARESAALRAVISMQDKFVKLGYDVNGDPIDKS